MRQSCGASQLAVDAAHAVATPPRLVGPLLARRGIGLAAIALLKHLPQQRLLLLRAGTCRVLDLPTPQHCKQRIQILKSFNAKSTNPQSKRARRKLAE